MKLHSSEQNILIFYSKWQFRLIIIYLSKSHMPNLTIMHIKLHGQDDGHTPYGHCLNFWNMFVIQTYSYHLNISLKCRFLCLNWFSSNCRTVFSALLLMLVFVFHTMFYFGFMRVFRPKKYPECKFCFKTVLCCYLWEMAVLCNKVSGTHIFIKRGVDKPLIHSNAVLFPSVFVRLHCTANKERKHPPEHFAT